MNPKNLRAINDDEDACITFFGMDEADEQKENPDQSMIIVRLKLIVNQSFNDAKTNDFTENYSAKPGGKTKKAAIFLKNVL